MEMPINRMVDGAPQQGKNVVTVAFYDRGPDVLDHWSDFQPSLANAVAKDAQSIERMLASFDDEDWQELDNGLSQVPKPYRPAFIGFWMRNMSIMSGNARASTKVKSYI